VHSTWDARYRHLANTLDRSLRQRRRCDLSLPLPQQRSVFLDVVGCRCVQAFVGNQVTCLKILPQQIQTI